MTYEKEIPTTTSPAAEQVSIDVGPHRAVKEADDLVTLYFGASPTEAEMRALIEMEIQWAAGRPIFLLMDFTKVEVVSASVRRAVGEAATRIVFKGVVIYGAGFHMRVIARMVNGALALFSRRSFPQSFHDTREEALAWIDTQRRAG